MQAAYAGDFQAYLIGWSGRSDADGNMWQMLHTGGTFNYGHYSNADVDKALDDARTVAAVDQRRAFYAKVWEQERKDLPLIYLWTGKNIVGMKKGLMGFQQVPDGLIRLQGVALEKVVFLRLRRQLGFSSQQYRVRFCPENRKKLMHPVGRKVVG